MAFIGQTVPLVRSTTPFCATGASRRSRTPEDRPQPFKTLIAGA